MRSDASLSDMLLQELSKKTHTCKIIAVIVDVIKMIKIVFRGNVCQHVIFVYKDQSPSN